MVASLRGRNGRKIAGVSSASLPEGGSPPQSRWIRPPSPPRSRRSSASDATDDSRRESLQAREEAHQVVDLAVDQAEHHPSRAAERRAHEKGGRDYAIGIDAHHRGSFAIE